MDLYQGDVVDHRGQASALANAIVMRRAVFAGTELLFVESV